MFSKLLIANRGEIACRVIATAKRLGIPTVAVFSDADSDALHTKLADEAVHIGPSPARESYLRIDAIIDAALTTGATAIHPGYGFLSENAAFANACAENGIIFVGPPASAIEAMGSKAAAKQIMEEAGVPLVPGYHGADQASAVLKASADAMGYPVLLKATAGGGGKGMRQVWHADEFEEALAAAQREASSSFGDDTMLVEKYLTRPRHVEVQVFCDNHGEGVYLAERDCSVQRRHQKVIEEAPAPGMTDTLREAMGETAVTAARAIDYRGAGTVEFLLDEDGSFYFMEMNTRLQVEHPVTEMITGQDLVEWQLRVASGEALPLSQSQIRIEGHALEARIYAEDPDNDFLPMTGTLSFLQTPCESAHVRVDTGVVQGDDISIYYDPMIAKLVVWDETRDRALERLAQALSNYRVGGTTTNIPFLYNLAVSAPFRAADLDTSFIQRHNDLLFTESKEQTKTLLPIAALALICEREQSAARCNPCLDPWSPWDALDSWRLNQSHSQHFRIKLGDEEREFHIEQRAKTLSIVTGEERTDITGNLSGAELTFELNGHRRAATVAADGDHYTVFLEGRSFSFEHLQPDTGEQDSASGDGGLHAPMNGTVVALLAEQGTAVEADAPLMVMEAMKMEHTIRAPAAGVVTQFYFNAGDLVDGGALLLALEESGEDA
ncbi:acetyl/propionyl/methylcrotonyl-CoA carboxylase subunit alpha [Halioglobus pacificus]|uniref:Biotin carboxylase n=1 Tax=Parahalioglobus pacificus TaxID=930806 RepID=A0A919CM64_9GAMM|nr:acetyl/propionyl/methylcrotonyl-CoA carboxylase subunit alpha [Halioglobus pacificus]GHD39284.1 3-methylcrotonyl-CoA carboxylase subunit alpha [Halioglobus pacificus]